MLECNSSRILGEYLRINRLIEQSAIQWNLSITITLGLIIYVWFLHTYVYMPVVNVQYIIMNHNSGS